MAALMHLCISLCLSYVLAASSAPTLDHVLKTNANLSSLHNLLSNKIPDTYDFLKAFDISNPITILAPSNAAFDTISYGAVIGPAWKTNNLSQIKHVMNYHVIPGIHDSSTLNETFQFLPTMLAGDVATQSVTGGQRIAAVLQTGSPPQIVFVSGEDSRSVVTKTDVAFAGGVLHVIDSFAIPPLPFIDTAEKYNGADKPHSIAAFVGALYATSNKTLANLLNSTSDITIFAPNNIALESVSSSLEILSTSSLADLLSYHILVNSTPIYSSSFANGTSYQTLQGGYINITFSGNTWYINSARLLGSDNLISNGVFHVLDNVLSPNVTNILPNPAAPTQAPVLPPNTAYDTSVAPFTTFLPDLVRTASSTPHPSSTSAAVSESLGPSSTSTVTAPSATSSSKSGACGFQLPLWTLDAAIVSMALCLCLL